MTDHLTALSGFAAEKIGTMLFEAHGADQSIDVKIAQALDAEPVSYTSSVEAAKGLFSELFAGWRLHVGYDVTGLFPAATASNHAIHVCENAPTVPLAILRCGWRAAQQLLTQNIHRSDVDCDPS